MSRRCCRRCAACRAASSASPIRWQTGAAAAQEDGRQDCHAGALHQGAAGGRGARTGPPRQSHPARLDSDAGNLENGEIAEEFVDWFEIVREDGRDADVGLERHWIDPTKPLSTAVLEPAHGALITSATLRDSGGELTIIGPAPKSAPVPAICPSRRGAPISARRSAMKTSRASSSSRTFRAAIPRRWPPPIANCFWPPAAARWACSPPCGR